MKVLLYHGLIISRDSITPRIADYLKRKKTTKQVIDRLLKLNIDYEYRKTGMILKNLVDEVILKDEMILNLELDPPGHDYHPLFPQRTLNLELDPPKCRGKRTQSIRSGLDQSIATLNYHGPLFIRNNSDQNSSYL